MPTVPGLRSPLTAAAYGERHGINATLVVAAIRDGVLPGVRHGRVWYAEDVPPPAALLLQLAPVPPPDAVPGPGFGRSGALPVEDRPLVARYTSQTYVNVLMGILAVLIAVDLVSFAVSWDAANLRGVGTRVGVAWTLWTRHRWARRAVTLWAGLLVIGGAAGLAVTGSGAPALPLAVGIPMFGALLAVGLFYLATIHRYIRIEPEQDAGVHTLEDVAREARLG